MSSFGVIENKNYSAQVPPATRLIPGKQSANLPGRKKSQSVTLGGQYWADSAETPSPQLTKENLISLLATSVLPRPTVDMERTHVALWVCVDMVLLTMTLGMLSFLAQGTLAASALGTLLVYGALLTLLGHSEGLYRARLEDEQFETIVLGKTIAWATVLLGVAVRLTGWKALPIELLLASAPLNYFGMLAWRKGFRRRARAHSKPVRNVLIVGAGILGNKVARYIDQHHPGGRFFRGFLDDSLAGGVDIQGRIDDLTQVARARFVDEVILAIPQQRELAREVIREARRNHLDIKVVPDLLGFEPQGDALESFGVVPVVTLHSETTPAVQLFLKRSIDCLLSGIALFLCSPLMLAIAAAIKLDSAGPALYCAPRMGKKGTQFTCFKFRTMTIHAERIKEELRANNQREGPFFKIADDPRLTRLGLFLRRYSLDELPQLWNVFLGEMSLVGPRPHPLDDFRRYRLEDFRRLDVTPGITGLWQVTARRDPSFERNMALDLQYIEQWNLLLDFKILWKTLSVVFHGTGA